MDKNGRRNRLIIEKSSEISRFNPSRTKTNKEIYRELVGEYPELTVERVRKVLAYHREKLQGGRNKGGTPGRRHTRMEIVWQVLARCRETDVSNAAREANVPRRTVQRWREKFGIDAGPPIPT